MSGFNCGCPKAEHIKDLKATLGACKSSFGQIQRLAFQRVFKAETSGVSKNGFPSTGTGAITAKTSWTANLAADDDTKITVSPYINNPETEPGAARTFGGDNQTRGGIPMVIGREPTAFTAAFYEEDQEVMAAMKDYACEEVGVYLFDEFGNIGCIAETTTSGSTTTTTYHPIPIQQLFVGDLDLGGYAEPDSNALSFNFLPNWSDNIAIVKANTLDFNPLTDIDNVAS